MSTISLANVASAGLGVLVNPGMVAGGSAVVAGLMAGAGPVGIGAMVVGGVLAANYMHSQASEAGAHIRNGCGGIYYNIKAAVLCVYNITCEKIYFMVDSTIGCFNRYIAEAEWVKHTYKEADAAYVAKCSTASYRTYPMDLQPLYTPLKEGVATQDDVLDALAAHAVKHCASVDREEIARWVALGEHLVKALNSTEASKVPAGWLLVDNPGGKTPIAVESSAYNMRAIMWYLTAHSLRHEMAKLKVLAHDHTELTPAALENIVDEFVAEGTFVFPDKYGKLFHFLKHARTQYTDQANVMNQASMLRGVEPIVHDQTRPMQLRALDDASQQLPGGMKRIVFNCLEAAEEGMHERVAIRFEHAAHPAFSGQRAEGHESLTWWVAQMLQGASGQIMYHAHKLAAKDMMAVQTHQQYREHSVHEAIIAALEDMKSGDARWLHIRKQAYDAMQSVSLYQVLPYLTFKKEDIARADARLTVLEDLSAAARDLLKKKIYRALLNNLQGEVASYLSSAQRGVHLAPYSISQQEVRDFWRTQIADLERSLLDHLYAPREATVAAEERHQYRIVNWFLASSATLQAQKTHDNALYDEVKEEMRAAILQKSLPVEAPVRERTVQKKLEGQKMEESFVILNKQDKGNVSDAETGYGSAEEGEDWELDESDNEEDGSDDDELFEDASNDPAAVGMSLNEVPESGSTRGGK